MPDSTFKQDHIAGLLDASSAEQVHYWIGLEDVDRNGAFKWIDGTEPVYRTWNSTLPGRYCAYIIASTSSVHSQWATEDCSVQSSLVCQIPVDTYCTWHELGDTQYLIKGDYVSPTDARAVCQSYGGDLAMIKTPEISDYLKGLVPTETTPGDCYLFGLSRQGVGDFTWIDGTSPQFTPWFPGQPNNLDSWSCFNPYIAAFGQWDDTIASVLRFICERRREHEEGNEFEIGNITFFISPNWMRRNFDDSRTYCQHHDSDLALVKSGNVNSLLSDATVRVGYSRCYWFGLTDQSREGSFLWIDGTQLQTSFWSVGEPNNDYDGQHCACLYSTEDAKDRRWDDDRCFEMNPFICGKTSYIPQSRWTQVGDRLFYIPHNLKTSYSFARKFCQEQGGDLAQPKTEEIDNHLRGMAGGDSYWFGLDSFNEDNTCTFRWTDGTILPNNVFPPWSGMSNSLWSGERCVHQFVTNGWSERPCASYISFACERYVHPARCPLGFYGPSCTHKCTCPDNNPCDKVTGTCPHFGNEEYCATGYSEDSVLSPDKCQFVGCYSSCSKTCHCSGGVDDCNSVSGVCSSGKCHPRWTGERCQTDRFSIFVEKTNPGVANFSCAVSMTPEQTLTSDDIRVAVGSFVTNSWISHYSSEDQNGVLVNSFYSDDIGTEHIYCFIGEPTETSEFAFVRLSQNFFATTESPTGTCTTICDDVLTNCQSCNSLPSWVLFALSMLVNLILSSSIVYLIFRERRSKAKALSTSSQPKTIADPSPYHNPAFDASSSDAHTYQDLKKPDKDATYEEIQAAARQRDYVNSADL